jgi:broad specificity phosphatase PhoE
MRCQETVIRATFIRHGQSTANVGLWTDDFATIPLTELGQQQAEDTARQIAAQWTKAPTLIVTSPYLRAQQTAAPTIARFPQVPVETWDIHEFTYWDPKSWGGGQPRDYQEEKENFWARADAHYHHGGTAESFSEFLGRARAALERLAAMPADADVLLFSHGHLLQAVRLTILFPALSDREKMQIFPEFDTANWVANVEWIAAEFDGAWKLLDFQDARSQAVDGMQRV